MAHNITLRTMEVQLPEWLCLECCRRASTTSTTKPSWQPWGHFKQMQLHVNLPYASGIRQTALSKKIAKLVLAEHDHINFNLEN